MDVIVVAVVGSIAAGAGAVLLLLRGIPWRLVAVWPALVVAISLALVLGGADRALVWTAYALGVGVALYGLLLLCWVLLGPVLRRHFNVRF